MPESVAVLRLSGRAIRDHPHLVAYLGLARRQIIPGMLPRRTGSSAQHRPSAQANLGAHKIGRACPDRRGDDALPTDRGLPRLRDTSYVAGIVHR